MPRYFFDVENGTYVSDPIGQEFIDDSAARKQAARVAKKLAATRKQLDSDKRCAKFRTEAFSTVGIVNDSVRRRAS